MLFCTEGIELPDRPRFLDPCLCDVTLFDDATQLLLVMSLLYDHETLPEPYSCTFRECPTRLRFNRKRSSLAYVLPGSSNLVRVSFFTSRAALGDVSLRTKSKAAVINLYWVDDYYLLVVTRSSVEMLVAQPDDQTLRLVNNYNLSVNWYRYIPDACLLIVGQSPKISRNSVESPIQPFLCIRGLTKTRPFRIMHGTMSPEMISEVPILATTIHRATLLVTTRRNADFWQLELFVLGLSGSLPVGTIYLPFRPQAVFTVAGALVVLFEQGSRAHGQVYELPLASNGVLRTNSDVPIQPLSHMWPAFPFTFSEHLRFCCSGSSLLLPTGKAILRLNGEYQRFWFDLPGLSDFFPCFSRAVQCSSPTLTRIAQFQKITQPVDGPFNELFPFCLFICRRAVSSVKVIDLLRTLLLNLIKVRAPQAFLKHIFDLLNSAQMVQSKIESAPVSGFDPFLRCRGLKDATTADIEVFFTQDAQSSSTTLSSAALSPEARAASPVALDIKTVPPWAVPVLVLFDQTFLHHHVLLPAAERGPSPEYIEMLLITYLNSLREFKLGVPFDLDNWVMDFLIRHKRFSRLNTFLQYRIIRDATHVACRLVSASENRASMQLSIDMFSRLNQQHDSSGDVSDILIHQGLPSLALALIKDMRLNLVSPHNFFENQTDWDFLTAYQQFVDSVSLLHADIISFKSCIPETGLQGECAGESWLADKGEAVAIERYHRLVSTDRSEVGLNKFI